MNQINGNASRLKINLLIKKKKKGFWKCCHTDKLTCLFLLCNCSTFTPKMQGRRMGTSGRITKSTSVSGEMYKLEHIDGSQSDTAVGMVGTGGKKRRSSFSAKVVAIVSRRSRSTSQLSQTGEWDTHSLEAGLSPNVVYHNFICGICVTCICI